MFDIRRLQRTGDAVMQGGQKTDVVILVMGPTGAGKSTLIRNILATLNPNSDAVPAVSNEFEACTRNVAAYIANLPEGYETATAKRLVIVDTPGFDDTTLSDSEILRRISVWLASSYHADMKVGGVVYTFPIYPNKVTRNDSANLEVFRKLCGQHALGKVRMVTTKWALCFEQHIGEQREDYLRSKFWKEMVAGGSKLFRLEDSQDSARNLLSDMLTTSYELDEQQQIALALQEEIVAKLKKLPETQAGLELKSKLKRLLREHEEAGGDYDTRKQQLRNIVSQLNDLKVPFSERIRTFFGMDTPGISSSHESPEDRRVRSFSINGFVTLALAKWLIRLKRMRATPNVQVRRNEVAPSPTVQENWPWFMGSVSNDQQADEQCH